MSFPSTAGGMESPAVLGQVQNRCKNSWLPSFFRTEWPAGMEQLAPALLGKEGLPHTELGAGRGARLVDPCAGVLPGRWEGGTGLWAAQSWLRKQLPAVPQSRCVIPGASLSTVQPEASPGFCFLGV